jgi:hypothetical protein
VAPKAHQRILYNNIILYHKAGLISRFKVLFEHQGACLLTIAAKKSTKVEKISKSYKNVESWKYLLENHGKAVNFLKNIRKTW